MTVSVEAARGAADPGGARALRRGGQIHEPGLEGYADWMASQPIGGVAVWAHTGRGLRLSDSAGGPGARRRGAVSIPARLLPRRSGRRTARIGEIPEVLASARAMARRAADLGADALLVHPPVAFRDRPDRERLILDYHSAIAEAGLPLIAFYLYEAAGGIAY